MRFNLATALMGDGYFVFDYGPALHGQTWWYDEYDKGAGSSLAQAIDGRQTLIPLAPGTASRFQPGISSACRRTSVCPQSRRTGR